MDDYMGRITYEGAFGTLTLENVLVTAMGGRRFEVQAHVHNDDPFQIPIHILDHEGLSHRVPEEWL